MQTVKVAGNARPAVGKKATKAVRNAGRIPCVIYGDAENIHFSTTHNDIKSLVYTPDFKVAEIEVDGATHKCIFERCSISSCKRKYFTR